MTTKETVNDLPFDEVMYLASELQQLIVEFADKHSLGVETIADMVTGLAVGISVGMKESHTEFDSRVQKSRDGLKVFADKHNIPEAKMTLQ